MTEAYKYGFLHARAISILRLFVTRVRAVETAEPIERNFALPRRVMVSDGHGSNFHNATQPTTYSHFDSTQPLCV